jgi:hypothetical protein
MTKLYVYTVWSDDMDDIRHRIPDKPTRFLDLLRLHTRGQGLAYRTEQTYIHWVKRFIFYHGKRHPKDMQTAEVEGLLTHLSINRGCSTNTQRALAVFVPVQQNWP